MEKRTISSSDIPVIVGIDNFKSVYELWQEKKQGFRNQVDNIYVKRGCFFEPVIIQLANEEYNLNIRPNDVIYVANDNRFIAKPDGFCEINSELTVVEVKTTKTKEEAKEKYTCQVLWEMLCTNTNQGMIIVFRDIFEPLEFIYVNRDEEKLNYIISEVEKFIQTLDLSENPFEPPVLKQEIILQDDTQQLDNLAREYITVCQQISDLEQRKTEIKNILNEIIKEKTITLSGYTLTPVKTSNSGYITIDISFIPILEKNNIPFSIKQGYNSSYIRVNKPKGGI